MDELVLRSVIYRRFAETGRAPARSEMIDLVGDVVVTDVLLAGLHDRHMIVLDDRPESFGEVRMALPFSSEPVGYEITSARGRWWANCAWDSFAVIAALDIDARISATWLDADHHESAELVDISITGRELSDDHGFVHFAVPARHWWDDIVET